MVKMNYVNWCRQDAIEGFSDGSDEYPDSCVCICNLLNDARNLVHTLL
jgi:hypothetical protein